MHRGLETPQRQLGFVTGEHHAVVTVCGPVNEATLPVIVSGLRQREFMRLPRLVVHMLVVVREILYTYLVYKISMISNG